MFELAYSLNDETGRSVDHEIIDAEKIILDLLRNEIRTINELCDLSGFQKRMVVLIIQNLLKTGKIVLCRTTYDFERNESTDYFKCEIPEQKRQKSKKDKNLLVANKWDKSELVLKEIPLWRIYWRESLS